MIKRARKGNKKLGLAKAMLVKARYGVSKLSADLSPLSASITTLSGFLFSFLLEALFLASNKIWSRYEYDPEFIL